MILSLVLTRSSSQKPYNLSSLLSAFNVVAISSAQLQGLDGEGGGGREQSEHRLMHQIVT